MIKNYGVPYQGSKNRIAKGIIEQLPSGNRLVDLFAGGCAITHCALESGKWNIVHANDLYPNAMNTFVDAVDGKYRDYDKWISRDDFFKYKDDDSTFGNFVRLCFSFGNNQKTYLYSQTIEPYKKACHYAVVFDDWDLFKKLCPEVYVSAHDALTGLPLDTWQDRKQRRLRFGPSIVDWMNKNGTIEMIQSNPLYKTIKTKRTLSKPQLELQRLQSLESLERLERLQSLERLERFTTSSISYSDYEYKDGDVVYCDPPYQGTCTYANRKFDSECFFEWVRTRNYPVYFSEYNAPDDFVCIWSKGKAKMMGGGVSAKNGKAVEKLYIHKRFV